MIMPTLRCAGRALDDRGQPIGEPCGRTFDRPTLGGWAYSNADDPDEQVWTPVTTVDDLAYVSVARAAGWAVGPAGDATCPRCRRPDPTLAALCRELARSVRR